MQLHVPVGCLKAEDFQDLADLAERLGAAEVRLTEDQNLILTESPANLEAWPSLCYSALFWIPSYCC